MFVWIQYFLKGGPLMWPLLILSLIAGTITLERLISLRRRMVFPRNFIPTIKDMINRREIKKAMELCEDTWQPVARIVESAISRHRLPREFIREAIENAGREEAGHLQKYLGLLATVASVSPLIGLLGTVTGMIKVFNKISVHGVGNATALSGGISEALITTAAGLIVGIPALMAYNYLVKRSQKLIAEMEQSSVEILEMLTISEEYGGYYEVEEEAEVYQHTPD